MLILWECFDFHCSLESFMGFDKIDLCLHFEIGYVKFCPLERNYRLDYKRSYIPIQRYYFQVELHNKAPIVLIFQFWIMEIYRR